MAKGKVGYIDLMQAATLSVKSEVTTYEKGKVLNLSPDSKWKTTGITDEWILIDHGSATEIDGVFLAGTNIVSGDTSFTFKGGTTTACSNESQNLDKAAKSYSELPSWVSKNYRYNEVRFTKASGTYGEIGKIFIFQNLYEFVKNWVVGYDETPEVRVSETFNIYGQALAEYLYKAEERRLPFVGIGDTQKKLFMETLTAQNPINQGIVFYDNVRSEAFYGSMRFANLIHQFNGNWNVDAFFREYV